MSLSQIHSAELQIEEAPGIFTYKWEISQDDLTEFVKSGQISTQGISGSVFYNGRYYPVYTTLIENSSNDLSYRIQNNEEKTILAPSLNVDYGSIENKAIDNIDPSVFSNFINLREVPGIGTLVEIMPCLPNENGSFRCLTKADIQLFSTDSKSLKKSDLEKDRFQMNKTASLKAELPDEFCALYIKEAGVYQVSGQDLADRDIDIRHIDPDNIKLYWWGEELPCRVTSTYEMGVETFQYHDLIQFYIPEKKNPYGNYEFNPFSDYDVIHLYWNEGDGLRYIQENSEIDVSISSENKFMPEDNRIFRSTVHIEENELYQKLSRLHEEELSHKYEHSFYSPSIRIGRSVSFPFELWDPVLDSPYNVDFTLRMQGLTYSVDDEMDHQILVSINNQYLLEDEWDGQVPKISTNFDMQYNHENLIHGTNSIDISVKGFESNPYLDDQVLFDWLKVSYDRYMIVHNNRLKFSPQHGPGIYMFEVKGLTSAANVLILKNENNWIRGYLVEEDVNSKGEITYTIYFEDQCNGSETYQVAGPGMEDTPGFGIESLDSIRYVNIPENDHYNTAEQGDYVIVTHKDFYEKALDLVEHKTNMGFTPVIYELERIYDEYNHGNESPYAIKSFLTDIYSSWGIRPEYVLFIGDTGTENPLPTIKYQSSGAIGAIIAENWFVDIDDDFVLEMALGRLPVSTEEELDSIIAKIEIFDQMPSPKQRNRMALISGPESTFKTQIQNYLNRISPDNIQTDRLYLYDSHVTGNFDAGIYATDTLVNFINDGVFCINYLGHGGGYTWDNYVLPYEAFERFKPGKPFIVNSLTCFTNTFSNDNALGEMFVRHPRGGVSVLSSTGYGWINSNYFIYEKLMQHMLDDEMSHGKALKFALTDYFFSTFGRNANFIDQVDGNIIYKYFRKSLFYQMCLLGDPSATFPKNKEGNFQLTPKSIIEDQAINITVSEQNITRGSADIVGSDGNERKYPIRQKVNLEFTQGSAQINAPDITDNIHDGFIQMTYWDNNNNVYSGVESISFNSPFINSLDFYPEQPEILSNAVAILLSLESYDQVDSVSLRVYSDNYLGTNYKKLSMTNLTGGIYKSSPIIYSGSSAFYTTQSDSVTAREYFSGNYFIPVIYTAEEIITGDYYQLYPVIPTQKDISILEYSIENGQSKLILFNQADTSVNVAVHMTIDDQGLNYSLSDTVLTTFDVDGKYEEGHEKINTFYFDFIPIMGSGSLLIEIDPLDINDSDTSNNKLEIDLENKWLKINNGHFTNYTSDTLNLTESIFNELVPGNNPLFTGTVYLNNYNRNYNLSEFGASQSLLNILYVNSPLEEIDLKASVSNSLLEDDNFVAYLSSDLETFYRLPEETLDTLIYFPIRKPGYYLIASAVENNSPEIELNINAREILTRGYVSERSDFSIILTDDHGINPLPEFWNVLLDGEEIPQEDISIVENTDIKELGMNFRLNMEVGEHTLQVVAHDLVGNQEETDIYEILYTGESQLIDYGTFPNPFTTRTTFIFELTEQFDDVTIKIFTISGKKIFTMSVSENAITDLPLYSIGYHEVPWYGRDEFGNTVANGVYFYIIEGSVDDKKIKSTGKIAKLR